MKSDVLVETLEQASARYERIVATVDDVARNRDKYLAHYLQDGHTSVADAIARGDKKVASMAKDIEQLERAVLAFQPGKRITFVNANGVPETAIIASIETPWEGSEHLIASYRVKIAVPGAEKLKEYGLETVLRNAGVATYDKDGKFEIATSEGLLGNDYEKILDLFDNASKKTIEGATFLVGNVFRAVRYATQFRLGSLVSFVDEKGARHRGVHINQQAKKKIALLAVRIEGVEAAKQALSLDIEINSSPTGADHNLVITPLNNGTYTVQMPEPPVRRNVKQWPSPAYRELYESMIVPDFDKEEAARNNMSKSRIAKATAPRAVITAERLDEVLTIVAQAGINTFYVNPKYREKLGHNAGAEEAKWQRGHEGAPA
jgi:hypothetical protein